VDCVVLMSVWVVLVILVVLSGLIVMLVLSIVSGVVLLGLVYSMWFVCLRVC